MRCPGTELDDAVSRAATLATSLVPLISFAVNAFVDLPVAHVAYEGSPGRTSRRYWQADVPLGAEIPGGLADLFDLNSCFRCCTTFSRTRSRDVWLGRSASTTPHSETGPRRASLSPWLTSTPALEALGPAVERAERQRLGLADERAHAVHRGVDVGKSNWKGVLLGWVRRDVICQGDKPTYDTARKATDGLEHGAPLLARTQGSRQPGTTV